MRLLILVLLFSFNGLAQQEGLRIKPALTAKGHDLKGPVQSVFEAEITLSAGVEEKRYELKSNFDSLGHILFLHGSNGGSGAPGIRTYTWDKDNLSVICKEERSSDQFINYIRLDKGGEMIKLERYDSDSNLVEKQEIVDRNSQDSACVSYEFKGRAAKINKIHYYNESGEIWMTRSRDFFERFYDERQFRI